MSSPTSREAQRAYQPSDTLDNGNQLPRGFAHLNPESRAWRSWTNLESFALVFAIEDVIMHKGRLLPGAAETISWLLRQEKPIPFVFVTNLDGFADGIQRDVLLQRLRDASMDIGPHQILVRSRPFAYLVKELRLGKKHVIVVSGQGEDDIRDLAAKCGFKRARVWTPDNYLDRRTYVDIRAVLVWSDCRNWDEVLDVIDPILQSDPKIYLFVCDEDFSRATRFAWPSVSSHTVIHMLDSRAETMSQGNPGGLRWSEVNQVPSIDNYGESVCRQIEALVEHLNQQDDTSERLACKSDQIKTIYLMTSNLLQDSKNVERHQHQTVGGPNWKTFLVGGSIADGREGERVYLPDDIFPDVKAAVSVALMEQGFEPVP
ncbi:hypothetical protein MFIFM68171_01711 [Madurella fahalii]|uniref:Cat eye syndrome critical region protein 5 n=1 Tax=Madurella fahalii TaxID=1157608 RepID=A0ABQ0G165_9PEZI